MVPRASNLVGRPSSLPCVSGIRQVRVRRTKDAQIDDVETVWWLRKVQQSVALSISLFPTIAMDLLKKIIGRKTESSDSLEELMSTRRGSMKVRVFNATVNGMTNKAVGVSQMMNTGKNHVIGVFFLEDLPDLYDALGIVSQRMGL